MTDVNHIHSIEETRQTGLLHNSNFERAVSPRTSEIATIVDLILKNRFSCRYFLPKEVDVKTIDEIIEVARNAPSGNNMQPWSKVYCVSGSLKSKLSAELTQAFLETPDAHQAQYQHYPKGPLPEEFAKRKQEGGQTLYAALGVDRSDVEQRKKVSMRNYEFFGAPVGFIFTTHAGLTQGTWLDIEFFIQNINIAARARGLETVVQRSFSKYHAILRKYLPIKEEELVVCGMSLGYPDLAKIQKFSAKQPKRPIADIIQYCGF